MNSLNDYWNALPIVGFPGGTCKAGCKCRIKKHDPGYNKKKKARKAARKARRRNR